jgi:hypothetical protein
MELHPDDVELFVELASPPAGIFAALGVLWALARYL